MSEPPSFDLEEALDLVEQDKALLRAMIALFLEHGPHDLAAIQQAIVAQDAGSLARSAHRLKGSLLQFGTSAALAAACQLEAIGKGATLLGAAEGYAKLDTELRRLMAAMREVLGEGGSA